MSTTRHLAAPMLVLALSSPAAAEEAAGVIELDETVISGNQELPKVLYILPWQEPEGMPAIDLDPAFAELEVFRRLYPPAYRRELDHYRMLEMEPKE